jgi:hypothetical protein
MGTPTQPVFLDYVHTPSTLQAREPRPIRVGAMTALRIVRHRGPARFVKEHFL